MKVLILGSAGSMGQRYTAVLNSLHVECVGFDLEQKDSPIPDDVTHCIIATPTENHLESIKRVIGLNVPVLVEKPMVLDFDKLNAILISSDKRNLRQVNNWSFLPGIRPDGTNEISYNYFRAGKNNDKWDFLQPAWLCRKGVLRLSLESPVFNVSNWNEPDKRLDYTQRDFDLTYVHMIEAWLKLVEDCPAPGGIDYDEAYQSVCRTDLQRRKP